MIKVAINGFGRIGRTFFRQAFSADGVSVVAINDLTDRENLAYLLKYDTVYGRYEKSVELKNDHDKNYIIVDGKKVLALAKKDPAKLPWKELGVDVMRVHGCFYEARRCQTAHKSRGEICRDHCSGTR